MTTLRLPASTLDAGTWTPVVGATLHECVTDAEDGSFIKCSDGGTCGIALDVAENPNDPDGLAVLVRDFQAVDSAPTCQVLYELMDGATVVRAWTETLAADGEVTDRELATTLAEGDSIVDWPGLWLRITDAASPGTAEVCVSSVALRQPDRSMRTMSS